MFIKFKQMLKIKSNAVNNWLSNRKVFTGRLNSLYAKRHWHVIIGYYV